MKTSLSNPKSDGFRMPAEYEPHHGTLMLWPYRRDVWREGGHPAQQNFLDVAKAISTHEPVYIGVPPQLFNKISNSYKFPNINFFQIASDDAWMRDVGPTFLINDRHELRGVDWEFNAWGGLYDGLYHPWKNDDMIAAKVLKMFGIAGYRTDGFVLEGGSIHVDGAGLALVTEACLLSPGRNPHLSKRQITNMLKRYLSVKRVVWIPFGVYEDETNEHVDNIACFVAPGHVLIAMGEDENDPQFRMCQASYKALKKARGIDGNPLIISTIPFPSEILTATEAERSTLTSSEAAIERPSRQRLAASYINFYICNGAIIMPSFGLPSDETAIKTLATLFPDRKIIPVRSREILLGGGNIHCITQQIPKGHPFI